MKHGSLFSGIGGFDLAAQWMGWENIFHCEWNKFGQQVLKYHFPKSISYEDITKTDFTIHNGAIDILTGGFPCQPYSVAGQRKGKEDERHLWPQMLRAIREIAPRYVVGENVRGLLSWNGGMVFDEVCAELEDIGYTVTPCIIPAVGVNAPHKRERIWFIAYSNNERGRSGLGQVQGENGEVPEWNNDAESSNSNSRYVANTYSRGLERSIEERWHSEYAKRENQINAAKAFTNTKSIRQEYALENRELEGGRFRQSDERNFWDSFPSKSPLCGGDDGLPRQLDGITFSKWRQQSIMAYGNAVVPQVVYQIFKAIDDTHRTHPSSPRPQDG